MVPKSLFPKLTTTNHRITSKRDVYYNCVAWAMGENTRWWQPHMGYYWPGLMLPPTEEPSVEHMRTLFESYGYESCGMKAKLEVGYQKIAIYSVADRFTHVAKQINGGWWASKLGDLEDIEHESLHVLEGGVYGLVAMIMRRPELWIASSTTTQPTPSPSPSTP